MTSESKCERTVYLVWRTDKVFDGTDVYVGSRSKPLSVRLSEHRSRARGAGNENNTLYRRMREVGVDNWEITALFSRTCDQDTIRLAEREKFRELNADLNTRAPITTPEERRQHKTEYYEKNKGVILKNAVEYYEKNKGFIRQRQAAYYKKNKQQERYRCAICEITCGSNRDLKRHLKTSRHFWKYIYSID